MSGNTNYEPDTFTQIDVERELDAQGLKWYDKGRYILSQCPTHEDKHPSVQIYKDDWFVNCHAECGRFHITKAYPSLRSDSTIGFRNNAQSAPKGKRNDIKVSERQYKEVDMMEEWREMPFIPRDHVFKGIDLEVLDSLGWRWDAEQNAYFIPYWNRPQNKIPFAQYRYLSGDVRFRFVKDLKPTMYGTWNLYPNMAVFLVEGASDASVLESGLIPWVAMPSASSGALMRPFAEWCVANNVTIIYAGDNDSAGDKLREALDEVAPYRVWQPPKNYKDWGDFFEAEGLEAVIIYCNKELAPEVEYTNPINKTAFEIMGGGTELEIIKSTPSSKELDGVDNKLL